MAPRARNPQTIYINISVRVDRNPRVFGGYILDKPLTALGASVKNKPVAETLFHPLFFRLALLARHSATNMFFVDIFFRNPDIFHFYLKLKGASRHARRPKKMNIIVNNPKRKTPDSSRRRA